MDMRLILLVLAMAGCTDAVPETAATVEPATCTDFIRLFSNTTPGWNHGPVFISPAEGDVHVQGEDFISIDGESHPEGNGLTRVTAAKDYHFADGTVERGAVGQRVIGPMCEWAPDVN